MADFKNGKLYQLLLDKLPPLYLTTREREMVVTKSINVAKLAKDTGLVPWTFYRSFRADCVTSKLAAKIVGISDRHAGDLTKADFLDFLIG